MTVLIDPPNWPAHGRSWSHLVSDHSFEELHRFARRLGVPDRAFEGDHYDLPADRYAAAVAAGAVPVAGRELLRRLQGAGLRRPKRRGERVVVSLPDLAGGRCDVLLSTLPPTLPVRSVLLLVLRTDGRLLVLPTPSGPTLPHAELAPGELPDEVAGRLGAQLLGLPAGGSRQLGYLRRVPPGPAPATVDLLLAVPPVDRDRRRTPAPPARWIEPADADRRLASAVAALLRAAEALAGVFPSGS